MRFRPLLAAAFFIFIATVHGALEVNFNRKLETDMLKNYNNKHRPVKKESTTVQVQIFISITHVEKVDEHEQTMMVHGHLWATWVDEYITWNPADYNGTDRLNIDSWRIWQPALALYNSAKGNSWYLYMNGMPAVINKDGKVWASGAFSFSVTCQFDFSDWPNDSQDCPIVLSDWVYDLSRVNLSDPGDIPWKNPLIKLNYDPTTTYEKKHVGGWEVFDTWRRHCYWGPVGCKDEFPEGPPEYYWSLLEFGVRIKRHAPYLIIIITIPTIVSCLFNLLTFWVDTWDTAICLLTANVLLQGIFGWDFIRDLPPGSGGVPRIVLLYGFNLTMTAFSFILHVALNYVGYVVPKDVVLPFQISFVPESLRKTRLFDAQGLSFDPQSLFNEEQQADESSNYHSPLATIQSSNGQEESSENDQEILIPLEENTSPAMGTSDQLVAIPLEQPTAVQQAETKKVQENASLQEQLHLIRRSVFCVYCVMYVFLIPFGIF